MTERESFMDELGNILYKLADDELQQIIDEFGENEIAATLANREASDPHLSSLYGELRHKYTRRLSIINDINEYTAYQSPSILDIEHYYFFHHITHVVPACWSQSLKTVRVSGVETTVRIESEFPNMQALVNVTVAKTSLVPNLIFAHNVIFEECDAPLRKLKYTSRWDFPDRLNCVPKLEITLQEGLDVTQLPKIVYEPSMPRFVPESQEVSIVDSSRLPIVGLGAGSLKSARGCRKDPMMVYGCMFKHNLNYFPNAKFHWCLFKGEILHRP